MLTYPNHQHHLKPLKQIIPGILAILNAKEKVKLCKLILFDFVIGLLDIIFLGLLLVIINFYTKNSVPPKLGFLPPAFSNPASLTLIGTFLILFGFKNWFGYVGLKSQHHFFYGVSSRLSKRNITDYLRDNYVNYININSSVQIRKISQQPIEFSAYILTNVQQVISQGILIFFTICAILFYHPTLFLLLFLLLMPPVVILAWFIRKRLKEIRINTKIASERTLQHLQETLSGYVESNLYHKNDFFADRYHDYQLQLNNNIATQQTLQALPARLIEIFAVLGFFILVTINKLSASAPAIDLLTIGIFMAASYKIIPGIVKILNSTGQIKTYQFTLTDLLPAANKADTQMPVLIPPIQSIKFERVYFNYNEQPVLNGVSFEILPGDFAGITGNSGKGKTTLINLLLGFIGQECGTIMVNNKITDETERQSYWPKISYVKQQPFLIDDSILKNITLADTGIDDEKLNSVLTCCGIDKLVEKYPDGIQKQVTENGKNISGGQRQRIMLARALYHEFDLLILDEPFGEMDHESEIAILQQLQQLAQQGKMILFITHNRASLKFCNKIILVDGA
jgi:ABC-type multidrug transport system fused ATPase/permease subunit